MWYRESQEVKSTDAKAQDSGALELEDSIDDPDDVFANNPSSLMLAKFKVKKKPKVEEPKSEVKPKTDACC